MRDLTAPYDGFMPWYLPGSSALGGDSFPSGHTSRAAGSFFLVLLCRIDERLKNKRWLFVLIGVVWTALIGTGRIVLAAHFASDVAAGAFLMLFAFALTTVIVDRIYRYRTEKEEQKKVETETDQTLNSEELV